MFDQRSELSIQDRRRRSLVFAGPLVLGASLLSFGCANNQNKLTDNPLSPQYLKELFNSLTNDNGLERNARVQTVLKNIVGISHDTGGGNGLKICQSGIYLTVAHNLLDKNGNFINPISVFEYSDSGQELLVGQALLDKELDLAIVYAPTYHPREQVKGLQLSTRQLIVGERLYLVGIKDLGLSRTGEVQVQLDSTNGQVDESLYDISTNYKGRVRVRGMVPWAGSSGSAIFDSKGVIVGLESGSWNLVQNPTRKAEVLGATISPLSNIGTIFERR